MPNEQFEPPVVVAAYRLFLGFAPHVPNFPKPLRFSLGQTIENRILAILQAVFKANTLPKPLREAPLIDALSQCELLKLLMRLAFELSALQSTPYFQFTAELQEIARQLSGWISYARQGRSEKDKEH